MGWIDTLRCKASLPILARPLYDGNIAGVIPLTYLADANRFCRCLDSIWGAKMKAYARYRLRHSVVCIVVPGVLMAQQQGRKIPPVITVDSSVPRIMSIARSPGSINMLISILRQEGTTQALEKRRELAESLVVVAVSGNRSGLTALEVAGLPASQLPGIPDEAMLDYIIRIHQQAQDTGTKIAAIVGLVKQTNPVRALPYLRVVAISRADPTASLALDDLVGFALTVRPDGGTAMQRADIMRGLREMWDTNAVTNEVALNRFASFAASQGWPSHGWRGGGIFIPTRSQPVARRTNSSDLDTFPLP